MSGELGVKRSSNCDIVNKKPCKSSKSSHFIGPLPRYGSYLHAVWRVTEQLPGMRERYGNIESDETYIRRYKEAWTKIYEYRADRLSFPVFNGEQFGYLCDMKEALNSAENATDSRQIRLKVECAWKYYGWLKEKQRQQNGRTHPDLRPPALQTPKLDILSRCSSATVSTVDFVPESESAVNREMQTALSYGCSTVQWSKPTIELPNTTVADRLDGPFELYRPEQYLQKHLVEKGGLNDYCSELEVEMGRKLGMFEKIRLEGRANALWQKTVEHMATAHNKDYTLAVATSHLAAGKELLRELHRRVCRKMTLLKSLKRIQKTGDGESSAEPSQYFSGEISEEQLAQITDSVEQERGVEGVVKATVDMTRFTFAQLEKVLMSNTDIIRTPKSDSKRLGKNNKVMYEIISEQLAHDFFKLVLNEGEPILMASKNGRTYKAQISADHPLKIGHRGPRSCCPVKLWVELFYCSI